MNISNLILNQRNILLLVFFLGITGCQTPNPEPDPVSQINRPDTQLVLNNVVLEQSNKQSNTVWKIKADNIVYSEDKQVATLEKVVANLLQNNTIILKLSAEMGNVEKNGDLVTLSGSVIASDPRNGSVITSESVEWQPPNNLLLIKDKLTVTRHNLEVIADSGKYFTDRENLVLEGNAIATSNQPALQLTSDRLEWQIPQSQIISPGTVKLVHYDANQTITERLVSDRAELNLADNQATLSQNIELIALDPQLQVATNFLSWNYQERIAKTDRPIQILDRDRQISLTGNQGEVNLNQRFATLQGGVQGINQLKAAELYARQIIWNMDTEELEAQGNIVYQQVDPQARVTGEKAIGRLGDDNIVLTGNDQQQVTSVINN